MAGGFKKIVYLLIGVLIIAAAFFAYRFFFLGVKEKETAPGLISSGYLTGVGPDDRTVEYLNILLSLQQIDLRGDIFSNPSFVGLKDFSVELMPQAPGRPNPFAPRSTAERRATTATTTPPAAAEESAPPPSGGGALDRAATLRGIAP